MVVLVTLIPLLVAAIVLIPWFVWLFRTKSSAEAQRYLARLLVVLGAIDVFVGLVLVLTKHSLWILGIILVASGTVVAGSGLAMLRRFRRTGSITRQSSTEDQPPA